VAALFHGFDYSEFATGTAAARLSLLPAAQEHILAQQDGKARLLRWAPACCGHEASSVRVGKGTSRRPPAAIFKRARAERYTGAGAAPTLASASLIAPAARASRLCGSQATLPTDAARA
jgi:hypothetical protein